MAQNEVPKAESFRCHFYVSLPGVRLWGRAKFWLFTFSVC